MERSWGREAMRFARKKLPALLATYEGEPADFMDELANGWRQYVASLNVRMAALPRDVPDSARLDLAAKGEAADESVAAAAAKVVVASESVDKAEARGVRESAAKATADAAAAQLIADAKATPVPSR